MLKDKYTHIAVRQSTKEKLKIVKETMRKRNEEFRALTITDNMAIDWIVEAYI